MFLTLSVRNLVADSVVLLFSQKKFIVWIARLLCEKNIALHWKCRLKRHHNIPNLQSKARNIFSCDTFSCKMSWTVNKTTSIRVKYAITFKLRCVKSQFSERKTHSRPAESDHTQRGWWGVSARSGKSVEQIKGAEQNKIKAAVDVFYNQRTRRYWCNAALCYNCSMKLQLLMN